jgi:hypothetical protein
MKIMFEYPRPVWTDRDPEDFFEDITMFDLSFKTTIHYFKNHDTGFSTLLLKVLGLGVRIEWNKDRGER